MRIEHVSDADRLIAASVRDGATIAVGGYFSYRHPMLSVRSLIRAGRRSLTVISPFGGIDVDLLIAAGTVEKIVYGFVSLDMMGLAPNFRRALENKTVVGVDFGGVTLARSIEAGYRGVPSLPLKSMIGSDIALKHEGEFALLKGQQCFMAPAIRPDVALIHVPWATADGAVRVRGDGFDVDLAKSAGCLVVTAEKIMSRAEFGACEGIIVARRADVLIDAPYGAHPTSCFPFYVNDIRHLLDYSDKARRPVDLDAYFEKYVNCSHLNYVTAVGIERLRQLEIFASVASRHVRGR